jgi:hypothetical protein
VVPAQCRNDCIASICSCRFFKCSDRHSPIIITTERTNTKVPLQFAEMFPARFIPNRIGRDGLRRDIQLTSKERKKGYGRYFIDANHPPWKSEVRKKHGKTEAVGIPPTLTDQRQIFRRKRVVPDNGSRIGWRFEQLRAMRDYARKRKWTVTVEVKDVGSGATARPKREALIGLNLAKAEISAR